ncbi:Rgp1-domain-containing protein [Leucosporidium creatinivorum]|uniref:Rgp1-domain-containing protein n=1 Tax=Leucosporidium creatinivorum TaxID=106004 RepID=A0A1Y2EY00_9BASI|nr:Rgp1-domain-containing protein [Leucosporidium creatinivorum]
MAPKSGLVVTVNPGSSAFFAGEVFTATITFANASPTDPATTPAPPPAPSAASLGYNARNRPPSASHQGLAEYTTGHLDQDGVPPSPAFGSTSGNWQRAASAGNPTTSPNASQGAPPRRPSFASTLSGGALPTPKSANFGPTPIPPPSTTANRSVTGGLGSGAVGVDEKGKPLPTRKGLIGKPIPLAPPVVDRKPSGGGLYGGGPRRPGGARGHGRTQSLAFSSPDLTGGAGGPTQERSVSAKEPGVKSHGRSRLGGSMGGDLSGQLGLQERKGSARGMPAAIEEGEEPTSPTFDDAAFPPSHTTSTPALQIQRPPSHSKEPPHSAPAAHPYGTKPPPLSPDAEDSDSGSDYDPADSHSTLPGHGFYGIGQNVTMESVVQLDYESRSFQAMRKASSAGPTVSRFDQALRPPPNAAVSRNAFFHPPDTLSLLWSFAHLEGTFEVDDTLIKTAEFVQLKKELLGGLAGVGGGTLEDKKKSGGGGGWKDWIWGASSSSSSAAVGGASLEDRKNDSMKDRSIPTFSSPPSILGVDLVLEPGESKSYTFSIRVPADLPPSFRGKAIKFSYHLVVGTSRSKLGAVNSPLAALGAARDATSRVMRVPVRVYNHVGVTGARPFYDLTNPIVYHRDEATTADVDEPKTTVTKRPRRPSTGRQDFYDYAANLLDSVATSSPELVANAALSPSLAQRQLTSPTIMESVPSMRPERRDRSKGVGALLGGGDEEEGAGCKNAVEIVTRNSQKVSYDINKDGYMVASLTLVKSAYRLGETVNGSVVINSGDGRVLRVSARLETHELIETTIATKSAPQVRQITRRLHAEHHETTLDSARLGFALAIPSGATPDFGTSGVKLQWSVRLSFLVIPPSPDAPLPNPNLSERDRKPGPNRLPSSMANGTASATRHGRSKSFAYGFEPAVPLTLPAPPMITPTGAAHLMPVLGARDISSSHTSYRAVPDLGFVPVLFSSNAPEPPPAPGPLQRSASGASLHRSTGSLSASRAQANPVQKASVVLVPAKVDTVECSIPIKVYPGNTPFRPTTSTFAA